MISLPSASAMDVKLQSPVPQLTSGERQARREGGPGKGRRMGSFPGRKLAGCFSQNETCDRAPRECFPHPPPLWLSTGRRGLEVDSKSLSQSIRFVDLVSR